MGRFKIQNLDELSDGRELLEVKPNKFTSYFIYILIAMLIAFLLWAWFSTKEIVVSASGIVEPNYEIYNVSPLLSGAVKSVNYKNGDYVKKGDIILTLNVSDAKNQLEALENEQSSLNTSIKDLQILKNVVSNDNNFIGNENKYYAEYNSYLAQKNIINSEVNLSKSQANNIQNQINGLQSLKNAIENNSNYSSSNSLYSNEFEEYINSKKSLEDKIQSLQKEQGNIENEKNNSNNLENNIMNNYNKVAKAGKESQVYTNKMEKKIPTDIGKAQMQQQINAVNQNNKMVNAQKNLSQSEEKLQEANTNANFDNELNSINSNILQAQNQLSSLKNNYLVQIGQELQSLNNQLNTINGAVDKRSLSKSLDKWQFLSQISSTLNSENSKLDTLNANVKELKNEVNSGEVKANNNGILYMPQTPQVGMVIKAGQEVAEIMPNKNNFKIKIIIPNDEIGNIKVGNGIKYSFLSFPYTEYGFLNGNLKSINVTSEINPKTGLSYYEAVGTLSSNIIKNKEGKEGEIKLGMACEAKIVSRQEKMLYYILNQLGLKTNNF